MLGRTRLTVEAFELPGPFYLAALATTLGGRGGDRDGVTATDRPRGHDVAPDAEVHALPTAQLERGA